MKARWAEISKRIGFYETKCTPHVVRKTFKYSKDSFENTFFQCYNV